MVVAKGLAYRPNRWAIGTFTTLPSAWSFTIIECSVFWILELSTLILVVRMGAAHTWGKTMIVPGAPAKIRRMSPKVSTDDS